MCIVRSLHDIGRTRATLKSFTWSKRNLISINSSMRRLACANLIRKLIILSWRKLKTLWSFEMSHSAWKQSFSNPLILHSWKCFKKNSSWSFKEKLQIQSYESNPKAFGPIFACVSKFQRISAFLNAYLLQELNALTLKQIFSSVALNCSLTIVGSLFNWCDA